MKTLYFFLFLCCYSVFISAQNNDDLLLLQGKVESLNNSIIQLENILKKHSGQLFMMQQQLLSKEDIDKEALHEQIATEVLQKVQNQIDSLQFELMSLKDTYQTHTKLQKKSFKRQKMHFVMLYVFVFVLLMSLIFIYFYFSKFFKEFEEFQLTCIEKNKKEMMNMLSQQRKEFSEEIKRQNQNLKDEAIQLGLKMTEIEEKLKKIIDERFAACLMQSQTLEKNLLQQLAPKSDIEDLRLTFEKLKSDVSQLEKQLAGKRKIKISQASEGQTAKLRHGRRKKSDEKNTE